MHLFLFRKSLKNHEIKASGNLKLTNEERYNAFHIENKESQEIYPKNKNKKEPIH